MATQASIGRSQVLVNKQFNSPIKLYSPENVAEVLNKQTQVLENGAMGIDFHQLSAPGHLANSAVLRMLAEEERQRGGAPKEDSPPPLTPAAAEPATADAPAPERTPAAAPAPALAAARTFVSIPSDANEDDGKPGRPLRRWAPRVFGIAQGFNNVTLKHPLFSSARFPVTQGLKRVAWPPPPESEGSFIESQPIFSKGAGAPDNFAPLSPRQAPLAWEPPSPAAVPALGTAPAPTQAPAPVPPPAPAQAPDPVPTPAFASPPARALAPASAPQFQASPAGLPGQPQYPPPLQAYQFPSYQAPVFVPPPSTVVLRPEPPISQAPFPVFESQPAAVRAAEPKMRGDEKWPPVEYKVRAAVENEQRIALARGPAVRPRKVNRDYSRFFAQHALTSNYPAYKAPPGTQHYVEEGTSNF